MANPVFEANNCVFKNISTWFSTIEPPLKIQLKLTYIGLVLSILTNILLFWTSLIIVIMKAPYIVLSLPNCALWLVKKHLSLYPWLNPLRICTSHSRLWDTKLPKEDNKVLYIYIGQILYNAKIIFECHCLIQIYQ